MNDNVYPNNGEYFTGAAPINQQEEQEKKEKETLDQLPLLKEVLDHLESRIKLYSSIDSIPSDVRLHPDEFMHVVEANRLTRTNLQQERNFILNRIKSVQR
jgi:hypothetical protein